MKTLRTFLLGALAALPVLAADSVDVPAPVALQVGQKCTMMLNSNAGTGYTWQVAEPAASNKVVKVELFGTSPDDSFCCGFPVPVTLTITGQKPGKALVRVVYVRPWEKGKTPAREQSFSVTVSPAAK